MLIKYTMLYDSGAYSLAFILQGPDRQHYTIVCPVFRRTYKNNWILLS
jgi:hypothetical protein